MLRRTLYLLGIIYFFLSSPEGLAQDTHVHGIFEHSFESTRWYNSPQLDVRLRCTFRAPDGGAEVVYGFWDGNDTFRVRFSPWMPGEWTFTTECNDTANVGLHGRTGAFTVAPYDGTNPLYAHGRIKISPNQRYFVYEDGTPFFYLAGTAWEVMWKSRIAEVGAYISDRKSKGFTGIHLVLISHQIMGKYGMPNQAGESTFLNSALTKPNPRYFDYVDSVITMINDSGMYAIVLPLWGGFNELDRTERVPYYFTTEAARSWARYSASRYSAHHVMWIIAGDRIYDTPEIQEFWKNFGLELKDAGSSRVLSTSHTNGGRGSWFYFGADAEWLDWHLFHSSHGRNTYFVHMLAEEGYAQEPVKPNVSGEPSYEDIVVNFWDVNDSNAATADRIHPADVRYAAYTGVLSGASAGTAYGCNGIWQWSTVLDKGTHFPLKLIPEVFDSPASGDMKHLRDLFEKYNWYELVPAQNLLLRKDGPYRVSVAANDEYLIAYLPENTREATVRAEIARSFGQDSAKIVYYWFNPRNGYSSEKMYATIESIERSFTVAPPDTSDWVLLLRPWSALDVVVQAPGLPSGHDLIDIYPNPCRGGTRISVSERPSPYEVEIEIFDTYGRLMKRYHYSESQQSVRYISFPRSGVYFYRASVSTNERTDIQTGKIVAY